MNFQNALIKIGRPIPKPIYNFNNPAGLKLLARLRLSLSHLNQCKFNHNFQNCVNPLCLCFLEVESVSHFFLHCHYYQGGKPFLNLLNSLNCSWIFLALKLFLKNTTFWLLFLKCSWKYIFVSDAHKVYSFIQLSSLDKKSYVWVLNNIWLKFLGLGYKATYKWFAISG